MLDHRVRLRRTAGIVGYQGDVHLDGDLSWQIRLGVAVTLALPDGPRVDVLAALGHPVRAAIVRHLIATGRSPRRPCPRPPDSAPPGSSTTT